MSFSNLKNVMESLMDDEKYADMTISCQGHDFKCHRAIICSQSPFFEAALTDGFKETSLSRVDLPCDDVDTIARVLSFCYLQDYSQPDDSANLALEEIFRNHLAVYLAADKFSMIPLRELASSRIVDWAKSNWSLRCFPDTVQDIWCDTPPHENKLHDAMAEIVSSNIQHFLSQGNGKKVFSENPKFSIAVIEKLSLDNKRLKEENKNLVEQSKTDI
ncbi:hypothetical protein AnigIFM49718_011833 [Aspergillus niger]|nr:hypothetical protein AnigIFM49718_011833 [Aspergillus niger]